MSVLWLLLILGSVVNVLTNAWRHGDIDLTGKDANIRGVFFRSITIGVAVCLLLRVNIVDIIGGDGNARSLIGWLGAPFDTSAPILEQVLFVVQQIVGIAVTGVVVAFAAKFWNDSFDILYEFKRWLRGHANAMKPEPRVRTERSTSTTMRRTRQPRRRGGSDRGGGDRGGGDRGGSDRGGGDRGGGGDNDRR